MRPFTNRLALFASAAASLLSGAQTIARPDDGPELDLGGLAAGLATAPEERQLSRSFTKTGPGRMPKSRHKAGKQRYAPARCGGSHHGKAYLSIGEHDKIVGTILRDFPDTSDEYRKEVYAALSTDLLNSRRAS